MKKPFNNKSNFDPGRFRYDLNIINQTGIKNDFGNVDVLSEILTKVKAIKLQIASYDQYALEAGASILNNDAYFIVRKPTTFNFVKSMVLRCEGKDYKLHSVIELDQPTHYLKLLGIWQG